MTPEQQLEWDLRHTPEVVFKPEKDTVDVTENSIKVSEEITGKKMAEPLSKDEMAAKASPMYHLADSDEEDPETVETRRSVKTVEKIQKHRFFINAKEKRIYEKKFANGLVNEAKMNFKEEPDEELEADPVVEAEKEVKKKEANVKKREETKAEAAAEA